MGQGLVMATLKRNCPSAKTWAMAVSVSNWMSILENADPISSGSSSKKKGDCHAAVGSQGLIYALYQILQIMRK